ncbi:MAG TPA: hypothetical protein VGL70_24090 [Candidatus Binatia bacterium]
MKHLTVSLLGFLIWMDMSLQTPMNKIDKLEICQQSLEVLDKKKLEQAMLTVILQNIKSLTPEQKNLARIEVKLTCRPEDEVR